MNNNMINVGTAERPVLVPEHAVNSNSDEARGWWEGVATGDIMLELGDLDKVIELRKQNDEKNGIK